MTRGFFITLDGIDGCGKSTQCFRLAAWLRLRGLPVTTCHDPGGTPVGDEIRQILLDKSQPRGSAAEALLFMASRAQLVEEIIAPALNRGEVVVSDRYLLSTVVYQGHGRGLDSQMLWDVGRLAAGGIEPSLTVLLDLPVEAARARLSRTADRMEREGDDFFQRVRDGFRAEAAKQPDRIRVVDATLSIEDVHARIVKEVSRVLETDPGT